MADIAIFRNFIQFFARLIDQVGDDEEKIFSKVKALLKQLITHHNWLPVRFATPNPERYKQYLLHCDPLGRFSVVSFVWGAGTENADA